MGKARGNDDMDDVLKWAWQEGLCPWVELPENKRPASDAYM